MTRDIALTVAVLGLAVYPIVRWGVKPVLRALGSGSRRDLSDAVRASACVVGAGLALLPGILPDDLASSWRLLLGVISGSLSIGLHHAAERAIRLLPERVAGVIEQRLLGRGMDS